MTADVSCAKCMPKYAKIRTYVSKIKYVPYVRVLRKCTCTKAQLYHCYVCFFAFPGSVTRNVLHGYQGILVLSQKPYLTDGSLREQVETRHYWHAVVLLSGPETSV